MKPTDEQVKEFWGKIADEVEVYNKGNHYHFKFGEEWYCGKQTSFASGIPVIDLNNLFKYAWDKAVQKLADIDLSSIEEAIHKLFYLWASHWVIDLHQDPALALFWAIYEVVKKEN